METFILIAVIIIILIIQFMSFKSSAVLIKAEGADDKSSILKFISKFWWIFPIVMFVLFGI